MVSFGSTNYSKRLLHLISWGHWFTFFNILLAITLSVFYLVVEPLPETLIGKLYLFTTWVSHMGFLTFIGFMLIIFPITLIYPHTRFIRGASSILFTAGMVMLLLDAFVYSRLGYHLNASSRTQIIDLIASLISQNSRLFWFIALITTMALLSIQLVVSNYAWKHLRELQRTVFAKFIVIFLVASFFFSHITHIWADANLKYDVLRQDTMLPLSYPATAKTLLTKYDLFNLDDYNERKNSPLSFTKLVPNYPLLPKQCASKTSERSAYLILTEQILTERQIKQFSLRASAPKAQLEHHLDNALPNDALFNLVYSLPSIYKNQIVNQDTPPLLFQALKQHNLASNFYYINGNSTEIAAPKWLTKHFSNIEKHSDISEFLTSKGFTRTEPGLQTYYFSQDDSYQFELFIDALLLSQRGKTNPDIVWISSIGNQSLNNRFAIKPALLIHPDIKDKTVNYLTSHFDVAPTLLSSWFDCQLTNELSPNGSNILKLKHDRIIANTVDEGVMVFNKDKSVFIDQNSNFQSYSRQLQSPIMVKPDFPLLIDGVNFIKRFTQHTNNGE
ncbi:DUF3413 domain-containing protein [Thalassotalea ganghwensis]